MPEITVQDLENAQVDAQALAGVVNGAADINGNGLVPTRTGGNKRSLAKIEADAQARINALQTTGEAFSTKAAANAALASVPEQAFITVYADESRSGDAAVYRKITGAYVFQRSIVGPAGPGLTDGDKGAVVVSGGGAVWNIKDGAVGPSKLAQLAAGTILGRPIGEDGLVVGLTSAEATAIINTFTRSTKGLVPASGGTTGTLRFLREDGAFAEPAGSGGITDGDKGDIVVTGGSWFIKDGAVGFSELINATAASRLMGRGSAAGAGDFQEITLGAGLSMVGQELRATATGGGTTNMVSALSFAPDAASVTAGANDAGARLVTALATVGFDETLWVPKATFESAVDQSFWMGRLHNIVFAKGARLVGKRTGGNTTPVFRVMPASAGVGTEGRSFFIDGKGAVLIFQPSGGPAANAIVGGYGLAVNDELEISVADGTGFVAGQTITQGRATAVIRQVIADPGDAPDPLDNTEPFTINSYPNKARLIITNIQGGNWLVSKPASPLPVNNAYNGNYVLFPLTNGTQTTTIVKIQGVAMPIIGLDISGFQVVGGFSADGTKTTYGVGVHGGRPGSDPRSETLFVRLHQIQSTGGFVLAGSDGSVLFNCHGIPHSVGGVLVGGQPFCTIDKIEGAYHNGVIGGTTVCRGGGVLVINGDQTFVEKCQMEHAPNIGLSPKAFIELVGENRPVHAFRCVNNNFGNATSANRFDYNFILRNCQAPEFAGNVLSPNGDFVPGDYLTARTKGDLYIGDNAHGIIWRHNPLDGARALITSNVITDAARRLHVVAQSVRAYINQHFGLWIPFYEGAASADPPTGNFQGLSGWISDSHAAFFLPPDGGKPHGRGTLINGNNSSNQDFCFLPRPLLPEREATQLVIPALNERALANRNDIGVILTATKTWTVSRVDVAEFVGMMTPYYHNSMYDIGP